MPLLALVALLILLAGAAGRAAPEKGKDFIVVPSSGPLAGKQVYRESHALLIGINEYARLPKEQWLEYAANDVKALTTHYGFPEENVTVLLNGDATRERIYRELARLADKRKVQAEDRILIYFSGHGQTVKLESGGDMGFLIPHDAEVDLNDPTNVGPFLASCVAMKSVWDYLESSPAKHVLVLADACYSGLLAKPRALTAVSPEVLAALAGRRAIQVVTAGRRGEVSYELSRFGHGAFTHKLLEELKAHADVPGAVFTATELYASVKRGVAELSKGKQTPQMGDYDTEGDFLFITAGRKEPPAGQVWVNPKDGAEMVYVPAGEFTMGGDNPDPSSRETPVHTVTVASFFIDKCEVTNAQYARFLNETGGLIKDASGNAYVKQDEWLQIERASGRWRPKAGMEAYPMLDVTWRGAEAYAKWAGKRLPTEAEWEKAARGTDGRQFPWGNQFDASKCQSAEDHHGHEMTAPVGMFRAGASPYGCLDMVGNVWEWTSTLHQLYPYDPQDGRETPRAVGRRVARGGSWGCYRDILRLSYRHARDPNDTDRGLGFRCVLSPSTIGSASTPQADQVWVNPKDGSEMVYVPAGVCLLGNDKHFQDERPQHRVPVAAFWIDKYEVTNQQFAKFLNATGRTTDAGIQDLLLVDANLQIEMFNGQWRGRPGKERHPVVNVSWYGAVAYAQWADKRLPTEAEWCRAAQGEDGRRFPWGNDWDPRKANTAEPGDGFANTAPVGSFSTGASPFGVHGYVWKRLGVDQQPVPPVPIQSR